MDTSVLCSYLGFKMAWLDAYAAGLVKAFDLAKDLAKEFCAASPEQGPFAIYDAATVQGMVTAQVLSSEIPKMKSELVNATNNLNTAVPTTPSVSMTPLLLGIGAATTAIKAAADLASLFKTNVVATGVSYGDGAKALFVTALAENCPTRLRGLGTGYFGELDTSKYNFLRQQYAELVAQRGSFADRAAAVKKLADAEKTEPRKTELTELSGSATLLLKTADAFIDSLKASDISDKGPLYNASRFLVYLERTKGANLLDFDIRLEGLSITKENIFVGQQLRLSGVAFLTYRVFAPDGRLIQAKAMRRMTKPIEVNLRGYDASEDFWTGEAAEAPKPNSPH